MVSVKVKKNMGSNNEYGALTEGRELEVTEEFYNCNKEYLIRTTKAKKNKQEDKKDSEVREDG